MTDPKEFIDKVTAAQPNEREELFEQEFPAETMERYLPNESRYSKVLGYGVTDVMVDRGVVSATFCITYIGESHQDEDGQYQDEDGDSYDYPEKEYVLGITVTEKGVEHEIV